MERKELFIGKTLESPQYYFYGNDIISVNGEMAVSLVGQELSPDVMEITVRYDVRIPETLTDKNNLILKDANDLVLHGSQTNDIRTLSYGTPVWYFSNGNLITKMYSTHVERTSFDQYVVNCQSAIGMLAHENFYGGFYTGQKFGDIAKQIIGTNGLQLYNQVEYIQTDTSYTSSNPIYILDNYGRLENEIGYDWRIKGKYRYDGLRHNRIQSKILQYSPSILTLNVAMLGNCEKTSGSQQALYGLYGVTTRQNTSSNFSDTIQLYACYDNSVFDLNLTIAPYSDIEYDFNPAEGKITVNGVAKSITKITTKFDSSHYYAFAWGMNGQQKQVNSQAYQTRYEIPFGRIYYREYYDGSGNLVCNIVPAKKLFTSDDGYSIDKVDGRIKRLTPTLSTGDEKAIVGGTVIQNNAKYIYNYNDKWRDIVNGLEFDENIYNLPVYGAIPICKKAKALYYLLLSQGVSLTKGTNGNLLFSWLRQTEAEQISAATSIYRGGSVDYLSETHKIELTEHGYTDNGETSHPSIYDNSDGVTASEQIIELGQEPLSYISSSSGLIIHSSSGFAAIISGLGHVYGNSYAHSTNIVERTIAENPDGDTVSITDCTLVTLHNSEAVADRLKDYYETAQKITCDIVLTNQSCGRRYSLLNPFEEAINAYLSKISFNVSNKIKANCEMIAGYVPIAPGGNYSHAVLLTGQGTWTVPSEVFEEETPRIRVILISGGQGGSSGKAGENGQNSGVSWNETSAADGGDGGEAGSGGRVNAVTIDNPSASYSYSCGNGGAGGAASTDHSTSNIGTNGSDTTFGGYSTFGYEPIATGVRNFFNGEKYGGSENPLLTAVKGGNGGYHYLLENSKMRRGLGESVVGANEDGGSVFNYGAYGQNYPTSGSIMSMGGDGGGAAFGQNGSDGSNATSARAGNGGKGGDAVITPSKITSFPGYEHCYGYGGIGGYGGGAGGSSGTAAAGWGVSAGTGGVGGYGGVGGQGADGCIIVYY